MSRAPGNAPDGQEAPAKGQGKLPSFSQAHGLLVLDKPVGPTSTDCLNRIKRICGQKKIGHAGTLDPLASGVLLVLLGRATKLAGFLTGRRKTYVGRLRLGVTTDTYDIQGQITQEQDVSGLDAETVRRAILDWESITVQEVPAYSAAKHQGTPLYKLARQGREVPHKEKPITVHSAEALDVELPEAVFRVTASAGTYVRSLVHSLGMRLGCGATLLELTREASHPFTLAQAHPLDAVLEDCAGLEGRVLGLAQALADWPQARLTASEARLVRNGGRLPAGGGVAAGARVLFLDPDGEAVAMAEAAKAQGDSEAMVWTILRGLW